MIGRRRSSGQHHGDLRKALEEAALALVAERGPHGFTLAEACRRAGVSVAAPYKHFADRDALLVSLAVKGYREQDRRFTEVCSASEDPTEQLAALAAAYVRFAYEEQALFDIMFNAGLDKTRHPELAEVVHALFDTLLPIARRVTGTEAAAFDLLICMASAAHGLAFFLQEGLPGDVQAPLAAAEERAARTARALVEQQLREASSPTAEDSEHGRESPRFSCG
ncbi:TetR/AcrR family transcriptional regulator [Nonomuraea sp. NPDC049714]|uniref:TetR/AcrR family transcriptional regulator n=1 Tax=Nonomuraea sp. NPDC049714 TaxID=3364357 RepID=UPI00378B76CF